MTTKPSTTATANDALRETGELTINIPALPRPTLAELQAKYNWIRSIERDSSPTEPVTLVLGTVLREDETSAISGPEYERRLQSHHVVLLGFQHRQWLLEHQDEIPALRPLLGTVYIDFPGLVVVDRGGDRSIPYAYQYGERWGDDWRWLVSDFRSHGRVAVSRK
jgi:hypothetical protein